MFVVVVANETYKAAADVRRNLDEWQSRTRGVRKRCRGRMNSESVLKVGQLLISSGRPTTTRVAGIWSISDETPSSKGVTQRARAPCYKVETGEDSNNYCSQLANQFSSRIVICTLTNSYQVTIGVCPLCQEYFRVSLLWESGEHDSRGEVQIIVETCKMAA